jgi:hypothetical protein
VAEHLAELIVAHLADVLRASAERGDAHDRVGRGAAGDLHGRAHGLVEIVGTRFIDEVHRALHEGVRRQERIGLVTQDVHERIADAHHVELSHAGLPCGGPGVSLADRPGSTFR